MKRYKPACFLLIFIFCVACSYGQVWKQYTDSAKIYQEQQKMDKAIEFYSKARGELQKDSIGSISYATSCNNLAILYSSIGEYEKAGPLFLEAKEVREKVLGKQHPDYAASCNNLATLYRITGQYEKAEPLHLEAKEVREKVLGKLHPDYAASCNDLAILYSITGQYEKAEPLFLEAKTILENGIGKQNSQYAKLGSTLALLYMTIGQYKKAEPLILEAKGIGEKVLGKQHPEYAGYCYNLGIIYMLLEQYQKAEQLILEAKGIWENVFGKQHPNYAASCNKLANLYMTMGQYKRAEPLHLEAKEIRKQILGKLHPEYASSCSDLAILYSSTGQYEKAKSLHLEAKEIRLKTLGKQHPDYAISCSNLASLHWLLHELTKAKKNFEELFSVNVDNMVSFFQFTSEREKTAYIKNAAAKNDNAYSFYVSEKIQSSQPYSFALFYRNLILSSSQALKQKVFSANDTILSSTYNEWINSKKYLSTLYTKPTEDRNDDVVKIEEKANQLEKELTHLSSAFAKQQQQVDWKDIQNKLQADEAAIEFVSFHLTEGPWQTDTIFYAALILRKDSLLPATVFLFNEKQLQALLTSAGYKPNQTGVQRLYTSNGLSVNNKILKKSIYSLIWQPIEKNLKGIKTIYFAPSGLLHKIAFTALPVNEKEVLSDRYKLVQLSTTATIANQEQYHISNTDKIQLYGGISYNVVDTTALKDVALAYHTEKRDSRSLPDDLTRSGKWNELPGTKKEVEGIISLLGTYKTNITSHSGINATEENIKSLDGKASPAVLHIATHGFFFPDPKQDKNDKRNFESGAVFKLSDDPLMRSGLLFAGANNAWQNKPVEGIDDGILTAYEVSNLYLPNTKLVVLSACETGLGDIQGNEGVYGLQRAFKIAGVTNLVMSLWKISDLETAEFMEAFYKNMFAQQTISEAFYNAQNVMKNKYRQQPYKWAAWVLVQ